MAGRAMLRNQGGPIEAASELSEHRAALRAVSRTAYVLEEREFARKKQVSGVSLTWERMLEEILLRVWLMLQDASAARVNVTDTEEIA
jgi:hypothetical protein